MPETRTKPETTSGSLDVLAPIGDLLQESFALLQKTIFPLFLVTLAKWVTVFVFLAFGFLLFAGVTVVLGGIGTVHPFVFGVLALIGLGLWMVVSLLFQILAIQIVFQLKGLAIRTLLGKSIRSLWPFLLTSLLMGFLILGGGFLFLLPGVFFAVLFVFAAVEVIIENQGPFKALKRSMGMVLEHFSQITLRLLVLFALLMLVNMLPHAVFFLPVLAGDSPVSVGFSSFLTIALSLVAGWYSLCYLITLYKQTKAVSKVSYTPKLLWPVLIAITGWIVAFIATVILTVWFLTIVQSGIIEEFIHTAQKQNTPIRYEKIHAPQKNPPLSLPPVYEL